MMFPRCWQVASPSPRKPFWSLLRLALTLLFLSFAVPLSRGENLLKTNPSFEEADFVAGHGDFNFAGWEGASYRWGSTGTKSPGAPGGGKRGFDISQGGFLQTAKGAFAEVTGGEPYLLTFQCQKPVDDKPWQWIGLLPSITFYDAAGVETGTAWGQQAMSQGPVPWQTVRLIGTAPARSVKARVKVEFQAGSYPDEDGRSFEFDDFSLTRYLDAPAVGFRRAPMDLDAGKSMDVEVKYRAPENSDLLVWLLSGKRPVAGTRATGLHGRGLATLRVAVPANTPKGSAYTWAARLVKPGTAWATGGPVATVPGVSLDDDRKTGHSVKSDDPCLVYEGRWRRDAEGYPRALWQGSSLRARFTGESFTLRYTYNSWDAAHRLSVRVIVDGTDLTPKEPIRLPQGSNQSAALASGLAPGIHTIAIIRDGEEDTTLWKVDGVELDADAGLLRYQPFLNRRLEFYGDSTFSGGEGGMAANVTKVTSNALGAASSIVSKGATGVSGGFVFRYNALYYWDRFNFDVFFPGHDPDVPRNPYTAHPVPDPNQVRGEAWGPGNFEKYGNPASINELPDKGSFAAWQADGVVIDYGQNDQFGGGPYPGNYRQFVTVLRKVYPKAHFFLTHTNMTGNEGFLKSAMEPIVNDRGAGGLNADGHVHMLILHPTGNTNNGQHPSIENHRDLALGNKDWRGLVNWIEDTLGWSGSPADDLVEMPGPDPAPARTPVSNREPSP